ncbi:MAG: hypothetical protein ACKKL6_00625 [Candidatus Komeilibacteria bacterium]
MSKSFASADYTMGQMNAVAKMMQQQFGDDAVDRFLRGNVELTVKTHTIDCDADPFVPDGWKVEEHTKSRQFEWNTDKVELYLSDEQKKGFIEGNKIRKLLKDKHALNANVLDYLLAHPELIPEEWKGKAICFWGTIYRNSDGILCVRYLYWDGHRWHWCGDWLDDYFDNGGLAVLSRK